MLVRSSDPEDRRRNVVTITGAGTRELRHLDIVVGAARTQLLEPLDAKERTTLIELLRQVLHHHSRFNLDT